MVSARLVLELNTRSDFTIAKLIASRLTISCTGLSTAALRLLLSAGELSR